MALDASNSVRVSASVLQGLGLLMTAWRVYFRFRIRRFWWEDTWAAILLFTGLLWVIAQWTFLLTNGVTSIVSSWIYSIGYTCIVALVRMSILFSIIRIIHGSPRLLKFTYACVAFFAACWVILVTERVWRCASNPSWHRVKPSSRTLYCKATPQMSIFEFTTECIAVSLLVVIPLRMLWRVRLSKRERRMILSIFASSVVLAFAALFHILGRLHNSYVVMVAGINLEVTLALFVCNLLVVVTYAYRYWVHHRTSPDMTEGTTESEDISASHDDDFTTSTARVTTMHRTTVDLAIMISLDCHSTNMSESV